MSPPGRPQQLTAVPDSGREPDALSEICGEIAAAFKRAWGRGPVQTTASWAGPDTIVVLLQNGHTDAEKSLRAAGHIQQLLEGRQLLAVMLEDELRAGVESATGRRVLTVLSATRLDPDISAEIFLLEPEPRAS
jgi:uncharacterized protein YbcI